MDSIIFPVRQGFPRAPDGGTLAPTNEDPKAVVTQAFAPAPLASPFPAEPTPPQRPFLPNLQAAPPVPVLAQITPFNPLDQDVDLMLEDNPTSDAPTYIVGDTGTIATSTQQSLRNYVIAAVTDYETGGVPTSGTVNLKIELGPSGLPPLTSYGVSLSGRVLQFTAGAWIPPGTTPQRQISLVGDYVLVVPNDDADGKSFPWPIGPGAFTVATVDVARTSADVTFLITGQVQNIVPSTNPLLDPDGAVDTELPVQNVLVSDQETVVGTPVDYFPSNHNP